MAEPTQFPQANMEWQGQGDVGPLPVFRDPETGENISRWELTDEERIAVLETGTVWLRVWGQHPAVYVEGTYPFLEGE